MNDDFGFFRGLLASLVLTLMIFAMIYVGFLVGRSQGIKEEKLRRNLIGTQANRIIQACNDIITQ